ncbi:winged helix-turn-helix domain-containing protein [Paenibacillus tepidiphilus]|uniref:winged helix-turn-helix domain-containing protein n=1 Tax=Paenibacillus tepidiphilus TaxID=2608683 RepID=UPI00123BDC5A|nr:winged helix-turn-helix domain-containing protein [Paenibacillus tepidiphilus]
MEVEWLEAELTIVAGGEAVELLPKEFALLRFLYRGRGRVFSREQLLDQVWPLEYPVERTVDDHIYRLRKKLAKLNGMEIKTVRGFGYSLSMPASAAGAIAKPTVKDAGLHEMMHGLLGTYHKYGQGHSMLTLARQQDALGYELDTFYQVCVHFVQGDLEWLLYTGEVELKERVYYLLLCYLFGEGAPGDKLAFCEEVLECRRLPELQHEELYILNILQLYVLAGEPYKAIERLKVTYDVIAAPEYIEFIPVTAISEMAVHILAGTADAQVKELAEKVDRILGEQPYLREIGQYHVVQGLWRMRQEAPGEAEKLFDEGLQVLELSGFVPLRIYALQQIVYYCVLFSNEALKAKYTKLLEAEQERMGLSRLQQPLEALLRKSLLTL